MPFISHLSYPAVVFMGVAKVFGLAYTPQDILILMGFSVLPDLDFIFWKLKGHGFDQNYKHHAWPSHWPIVYLPFVLYCVVFPSPSKLLAGFGILSHFIMDSFFCVDGVMWLYPFSTRRLNFFAVDTGGVHGWVWFKAYYKSWFPIVVDVVVGLVLVGYFGGLW